ncbi:cysteine methyltransferase [Solibacillus sp. R5-41]|uniref:cysteine methyltransferase n=1 Tax=Solibacillus sp. R5-41 TaxID=2048654 RepID=UPI000C127912|nr:cysteine methyltransferase [Solibacillus sp. R5-41]ATP41508.1 cysteine methyltransferase [Solibacillus sp. R5-41]
MQNNQDSPTTLYLATDEQMQLHLTSYRMQDFNAEEFGFLVRANCYYEIKEKYAKNVPLQLILGLSKNGLGMSLAIDLNNIPNTLPKQMKKIVEHIQKSPAFLQSISSNLNALITAEDPETTIHAAQAKQFFLSQAPRGITSLSTNRQTNALFWLYYGDKLISNVSPFTIDDTGGHIAFTVKAGFSHEYIMQCYEVECMMHLFNEEDKLGYYFELYLDQENFHHEQLYNTIPDQFMENEDFLNRILLQMKKCNNEQYDDYLQDLIEKFAASI